MVVLWVWLKWVVGHCIVGCGLLRLVMGLVEIGVGEVTVLDFGSWRGDGKITALDFGFHMVALVLLGSAFFFFLNNMGFCSSGILVGSG